MSLISAIVLTLNEEENIKDCLRSLQWCDEIIVVDSYSEDDTVAIAEEYADTIIQEEVGDDGGFDQLRAVGAEQASGDWLLRVDADELVPKELAERLQQIADQDDVDVVRVPRKNYIFGEWMQECSWWPDHQTFMFRPGSVEIGEELHGFFDIRDDASVLELEAMEDNAFHHFSRLGARDFLDHMNEYTSIEAEQDESVSRIELATAPVKEFGKLFVLHNGYRAGLRGLLLCLLRAQYRMTTVLKRLERKYLGTEEEFSERYQQRKTEILEGYDE